MKRPALPSIFALVLLASACSNFSAPTGQSDAETAAEGDRFAGPEPVSPEFENEPGEVSSLPLGELTDVGGGDGSGFAGRPACDYIPQVLIGEVLHCRFLAPPFRSFRVSIAESCTSDNDGAYDILTSFRAPLTGTAIIEPLEFTAIKGSDRIKFRSQSPDLPIEIQYGDGPAQVTVGQAPAQTTWPLTCNLFPQSIEALKSRPRVAVPPERVREPSTSQAVD